MTHLRFLSIFSFAVIMNSITVYASEFGTPEEARAMLERAVAALQKDKSAALEAFNKKDGGYRDRDLYVFCAGPDGIFSAHPRGAGKWNMRAFVDLSGKPVGEEVYEVARKNHFSEVAYLVVRGEEPGPRKKTSLITKVDDQVCGVGYFNPGEPTPTTDSAVSGYEGIFIYGYDPVAYFTMDKAVKGSPDFIYEYLGGQWHFVSDEHRRMFVAEPVKYIPQHGGYCSSAATGGNVTAANPRAWRIIDGKLYLFASNRVRKDYVPDVALDADWQQKLMELVSQ
ncbi:MAG: YHS domain-containing (seleno)protein [Arenicellales bacterium]|nr:YHS domain-containing (seleno)protein [Arenicellales bacterium]